MIRIYFDNKPLFLCDHIDAEVEPFVHHDDTVFIDELDPHSVKSMIHEMQQPAVKAGVFLHHDMEELKTAFFKKFKLMIAGGGLVLNDAGELLVIFRRGKWDLPKGKLDEGETIEACALREVREETGLANVVMEHPLTITYHTYHEGTKFVLKESHWYQMKAGGEQELFPQTEEDIEFLKWVKPGDVEELFSNTFPSIIDVFRAAQLAK